MLQVVTWIFLGSAAVHAIYYLFVYSRVALHKSKNKKAVSTSEGVHSDKPLDNDNNPEATQHVSAKALPPVTVLICARDEAHNLKKYLPIVCEQVYPTDYEVLVVNDLSEDDTMETLFDLGRKYQHLDYRTIPEQAKVLKGKKFALTIGVKAAKYPNVILTDADCYPSSPFWLQKMAACFSDKKNIVLGFGAYEKRSGFLNTLIRYETFMSGMSYLSFAKAGMPYMGVGRNLAYTKPVFFSTNVFVKKPQLASGDDDLLVNAVATGKNTAVCIDKEGFTVSGPKLTWDEWLFQKRRHVSTAAHYKFVHKALLALFQLSHVLFYLTLILMLIYSRDYALVGGVFGFRLLLTSVVHFFAMRKLGTADLWLWSPIFDALYPLYYAAMLPGLKANPQSSWK